MRITEGEHAYYKTVPELLGIRFYRLEPDGRDPDQDWELVRSRKPRDPCSTWSICSGSLTDGSRLISHA